MEIGLSQSLEEVGEWLGLEFATAISFGISAARALAYYQNPRATV